jgi:hypothetical protein
MLTRHPAMNSPPPAPARSGPAVVEVGVFVCLLGMIAITALEFVGVGTLPTIVVLSATT